MQKMSRSSRETQIIKNIRLLLGKRSELINKLMGGET